MPWSFRELHEKLTDEESVHAHGSVGILYRTQVRRVRELVNRLEQVDPEWIQKWKVKEQDRE